MLPPVLGEPGPRPLSWGLCCCLFWGTEDALKKQGHGVLLASGCWGAHSGPASSKCSLGLVYGGWQDSSMRTFRVLGPYHVPWVWEWGGHLGI